MKQNPLSTQKAANGTTDPHMKSHAQVWQHINSLAPNDMEQMADRTAYVTPIFGKLAADPDVTRKDVIKATAAGVADGKSTPSEAVKFITQIPDDPMKFQSWIKNLYMMNLSALIHMKAAQGMPQAPSQAQAGPGAAPAAMPIAAPPAAAVIQQ